jgi:hypothetical protein
MSEIDLESITPTYYQIEIKDEFIGDNLIKTEQEMFNGNQLTQYVVKNIPSTSNQIITSNNEFSLMIEDVKQEPSFILDDLILPEVEEIEEIQGIEAQEEIVEEQIVAYEVRRNEQGNESIKNNF